MATVSVRLVRSGMNQLPVAKSVPYLVEEPITTTSSSQQGSTAIGPAGQAWYGLNWRITVTGGNVWVKFGANPTAAAGADHLILDGQTDDYELSGALEKIAVIDA